MQALILMISYLHWKGNIHTVESHYKTVHNDVNSIFIFYPKDGDGRVI